MAVRTLVALVLVLAIAGCSDRERVGSTYYERNIEPILTQSCVGLVSPCHRDDDNGVALGNLDLSSFDSVQQRRDVLRRRGAYPEAALLIKAVASQGMLVDYDGEFYPLEITHAGGPILSLGSDAYFTLKQWLDNGATENGLPAVTTGNEARGACAEPLRAGVDPATVSTSDPGFAEFVAVQDYLVDTCGAGSCHGSPRADYYLTCGTSDEQTRANYIMTRAFIADVTDDSPLLTKALDPSSGGDYHTGGAFFPHRDDADYEQVHAFAVAAGRLPEPDKSAGRAFFDERVMPVLLQRGCAMEACHSEAVPFKVNLRAGAQGFFSSLARETNYHEVIKFLALESPNPIASRIIVKNVLPLRGGIAHRAGPVLETPGGGDDPLACPDPYDPDTATPLCTIVEWRRLERAALDSNYRSELGQGQSVPLVYVERPADAVRAMVDAELYRPGADLVRADATIDAGAGIDSITGSTSLLDGCPGVSGTDRSNVDVRAPEPSLDGTRITFAMRVGPGDGLDVYEVGVDGTNCRQLTTDGGTTANGIKIESFDPYYVVDDDALEWVVYASTRGGSEGPARTPKSFVPATDLWRQPVQGGAPPERLTFLRGLESQPFAMNNGMIGMVVEKSSADLYQFSGRRLNWDRSDYHPLLGQRAASYAGRDGYVPGTVPPEAQRVQSFGYTQVSEIRNLHNDNFVFVLSDAGSRGEGGALGVFNRSVGPFEAGRDDPGYMKSLTVLPGPTGRAGDASGAYRSPYPLPDGQILASFAGGADVGDGAPKRYELVTVNARTGDRRVLRSGAGSLVEAVLVIARPPPHPFVHAASTDVPSMPDHAVLHYTDLPLLATLQGANDRRGRHVQELRNARRVRYFTHRSPPASCAAASDCAGALVGPEESYEERVDIGSAPLGADGSAFIKVPANRPLILELLDENDEVLFRMREETQFGPFENMNLGVPEAAYRTLCAVCHGSVSGRELDIGVDIDVITSASLSEARSAGVRDLE